jgi:translation elongation factor EF-1beta
MYNEALYNDSVKAMKERAKKMNDHLAGKTFLVGQRLTLADISNFMFMAMGFVFIFDGGFRKAMPNLTAWFERVAAQSAVIAHFGCLKMCEKAMKPQDVSKLPKVEVVAKPAAPAQEEKKADDDDFDPFADEEEDEEAEKAKMERMKEIAKTAKNYGKAKPVAKSIIVWEVKPWGEETDLDEMAKLILAIEQDGLVWKTEYKKEPIAYGVYKLVIGATVEDEKVSTDDIAEKIEALEDHVQSVDVQSFNKL